LNSSPHSSDGSSVKHPNLHLPLEQLTSMLRREGFSIKPDDYIELLKVVEKFGSEDIAALKTKLCPLIATSEEEQAKFYHVFDEYVRINLQPGNDTSAEIPGKPLWKKILPWLIPFTALLAAILFFASNVPVIEPNFTITIRDAAGNSYRGAIPGDSLLLDASTSFANQKEPDTQAVTIRWNFGKGWSHLNQLNPGILLQEEGMVPIVLEIASGTNKKRLKRDTQFVKVCASDATGIVTDGTDAPVLGGSLRLKAAYRGSNQNISGAWFVNGENKLKGNILPLTFKSPGNYMVEFVPDANKTDSLCYPPIETSFTVADTLHGAQLSVSPSGSFARAATQYKFNRWWLLVLSALVVASLAIVIVQHRKARKKLLAVAAIPTDINRGSGKKLDPPYEVPFENRDLQYVVRDREMNLFFRSMRSKTEDDFQALNVPKTIKSVIQSGGVPSLVFTNKLKYQEYLLLIDQSNIKSQQLKLFEYLCNVLADENVTVEKFYYNNFDVFKNQQYPNGISLQRLCELYKTHTLVIFGNAWQLIYPAYPVLDKEIVTVLQEWEYKAILTPIAYKDWGLKETLLKKSFVLLPADPEGQVRLMQAIKERQIQHDKYLSSFESFYEPSAYDLYSIKDIKEYLGDETLFQWLCATCIYPRLRWEILIEMGKLICGRQQQDSKFNYASLLKLVRIPWMAEGSFPEKTRLDLLKQLSVENEVAAREKILEMLRYADIYFGDQHFFSDEKKLQQLTNEFVLFASNKEKYPQYRHSEQLFKNRWQQQKIYDGPLRVYLEKSGEGQWHTPIQQDGQNPGLREYFNTGEKKAVGQVNKAYNLFYGALAVLLLTLGLINKDKFLNSSFAQNIRLSIADSSSKKLTYLILSVDSCVGNINSYLAGARGRLDLNGSSIDLSFDNNGFVPLNLTTAQLNLPSNSFTLRADSNVNIRLTNLPLGYDTVRLLLSGICSPAPAAKSPLYIRYNNNNSLPVVNQLIQSLSDQYQVTAEFSSFDGASRLVYYNLEKENEYLGLAKLIGQQTGITLETQYIEENRTPPAVPIVLLNFASLDCNPVATGNLPQALNEIWSAAGNNLLININLQRAIIWYSTGSNSTYGTYRIVQVCRYSSGTYKIITQANNAYKAFFIRNIQSQSLELSVCQNLLSTREAVDELGETSCDSYNRMSPYYETNDKYIFLPVNNGPLATQEAAKLREIARQMNSPSNLNVQSAKEEPVARITIFENRDYVDRSNADAIDRYLDNYKINHSYTRGSLMTQQGDNPFARNYITLTIDKVEVDPCSITFQSIADAMKQVDKVCRLDISNQKLESLPKELAEFKSLQYIDVRNNFLSARDSISLYRLFPNARILFYPQQKIPEPPANWTFLKRIELDAKGRIDNSSIGYLKTLVTEMQQNRDARLKLVAYYNSQREDKKNASLLLDEFQTLLLNRYGFRPYSNRIETEINPVKQADNPARANFISPPQQKNPSADTRYIDIYGLNIGYATSK